MPLNNVTIIPGQNTLGRSIPGEDYLSGIIFYSDFLPSGFQGTGNNIQQVLSLAQAESLGIVGTYPDETAAVWEITVTGSGAVGDVVSLYVQEPQNLVLIGQYTRVTGDTTATIAAGLVQNISVNRNTTGYSAVASGSTVEVTFRAGLGLFPNTGTPLSAVIVGSITCGAPSQAVTGVPSLIEQWYYHVSEYFRINPTGNLYVGFFPVAGQTWNFAEVQTMQIYANGIIRQVALYLGGLGELTSPEPGVSISSLIATHYSLTAVTVIPAIADLLQVQCSYLATLNTPIISVFSTDMSTLTSPDTFTALTKLKDLTTHNDNRVSVTISQDGAALGYSIFKAQGTSITDVGAVLGAISLSAVSQSIAWVAGFNMTNGVELAVPAYANGRLFNQIADANLELQLQNYSYIYLKTFQGVSGTFNQNNSCAITPASNYAYINDNRTWDKASRLLYAALIPDLSASITLNADGTLAATSIAYIQSQASDALNSMLQATPQELSAYKVVIPANQNIIATNTLVVQVQLLEEAIARNIVVNLNPVSSIQ